MADENIKNEVGNDNINEEATEPLPDTKIEATPEEPIKNEVKTEEVANEPEFKNKTDRMKHKKVNCKGCGASLTLKTLRYSHKCFKTEDKEIKPKPKPKAKPKAVEIQPPVSNSILTNEEPVYIQQVKQQAPAPPPRIKTPQEIINDNFMLIQQQYINQRREKANNLVQSMFSGGLRNKRR